MVKVLKQFWKTIWSLRKLFMTGFGVIAGTFGLYFLWSYKDELFAKLLLILYLVFSTLVPAILWIVNKFKERKG